jgi:plastocyanin
MRSTLIKCLTAIAAFAPLLASTAHSDVLLDETKLVGLPSVAQPSEFSFTASSAQALTVTLTDFQQPAAFTSLQIAVTLDDAVVGTPVSVNATTHKATVAVPAAAGNYVLHVIGTPAIVSPNTQGFGSFGVCVAPAGNPTSCIAADSYSGNIQTPAVVSTAGTSTLNTNFTSTVAGTYTVTLTDDAFPVALQTVSAGILQGATPVQVNIPAGTPTQVTLAAGTTYSLLVAAIANTTVQAGLYGIKVADPTGATVFNRTLPVGTLPASTIVDNTSAQGLNLVLTDFAYPAALASVGVAITEGSTSLAQLTAPGSLSNFIAPAGSVEIWQYAVAGAQPGVYSVGLSSTSSSASLFSLTKVVNPAATTGQSYAFAVSLPSAGTYSLVTSDFQFPSSLQSISATVAQNGTVLPQTSGNFTAAAGYVVVVVNAVPPQSGNGIFGVTVQTSGSSPTIYLDQTQAVGGVFSANTINFGNSGGYDVTLTDLAFPALFQNLAVVLSRGSQVLGKIYGGGTFSVAGTPGLPYVLTFVATPNSTGAASTQNYGLYSIRMASSPPTVVFTAASSSVTAGQTVTLTWSSTNATSCTAGGSSAWTGPESTSGTLAVSVSATATLTLTCTGNGGSAAQSVTVTASAAAAKSSGGGGAVDWWMLAMLGVWAGVRRTVMRPSAATWLEFR